MLKGKRKRKLFFKAKFTFLVMGHCQISACNIKQICVN